MKRLDLRLILILFSLGFLVSCNNNEIDDLFPGELVEGCYVVNYGSYGKGGGSISKYDYNTGLMTNFYNEQQNGGREFLSNIQYAYTYNDSVYLIGNLADQLVTMNPLLVQSKNGVSEQLNNPRFCVASGDYLYISCLGPNPDWSKIPGSYIAKLNINSNKVEKTIKLPGGPEGMEVANGKLFVALNYKDSIGVIDLKTEQVSYIATPAVTSYFVKDKGENLYVTLVSTYNNFSTETGLGYINTKTAKLESTYKLDNVSSSYGSVIQSNDGFTKIYVITSAYDANWNLTGAVAEFNVATKTFNSKSLVSGISGISGIAVNPKDDNMYVFSAPSVTGAGKMDIYSSTGTLMKSHAVGAFPIGAFFLE
ncbi:MAG: hypothetical protein FD181_1071 [Prolixibacteraceae bacterium]|nr:MAG: hypothetical protein FD181_1071 [Prolixibacteraceae bacterium]